MNKEISNNNNNKYTNNSANLVKMMRENFEKYLITDGHLFDENDIEKVKNDDWFVKRYLLSRNRNVEEGVKLLVDSLKWRKEQDFRNLPRNYFPEEFYRIGGFFDYEPDLDGHITLYIRIRYLLKSNIVNKYIKKWCEKLFYDIDDKISKYGLTVVIDFNGTGLKNAELDLLHHALYIMKKYAPYGLRRVIIVDLPMILRFGYNLIKKLLPKSGIDIIFSTKIDIVNYIPIENLPDFLNGTCKRPYKGLDVVPNGAPKGMDFAINVAKIDQKTCKNIFDAYKNILNELEI